MSRTMPCCPSIPGTAERFMLNESTEAALRLLVPGKTVWSACDSPESALSDGCLVRVTRVGVANDTWIGHAPQAADYYVGTEHWGSGAQPHNRAGVL